MTIYATGNPVGSTNPKDLIDNSQNLDYLELGPLASYPDRLGVNRLSRAGIEASFAAAQAQREAEHDADQARRENEFDADQTRRESEFDIAQADRVGRFDTFIESSGWQDMGAYTAGIVLTNHNQYVTYLNQPYTLKPSTPTPYTTTGVWGTEGVKFMLRGDDTLRQELANTADPTKNAAMVGWKRSILSNVVASVHGMLDAQTATVWEYANLVTAKPNPSDPGTWDWTPAFSQALTSNKKVRVPNNGHEYLISSVTVAGDTASLVCDRGVIIRGSGTVSGGAVITLSGAFADLVQATLIVNDATVDGIRSSGFRNTLFQVTVTGTSQNALSVLGLETTIILGKFKGGATAGILLNSYDCYMQNVYVEGNKDGIYANGVGSITAHHIHSFNNTRHGFFLSGAGACQLSACYADTNGANGFEIRDINAGMQLVDCWAYKSSNASAGENDFNFFNAKQVKLIGCRSSGTGAFAKGSSYKFDSTSEVSLVSCNASIAPVGVTSTISFTECSGSLLRYNRPTDTFQGGGLTIAAAATLAYTLNCKVDGALATPGLMAFELAFMYRNTSGNNIGVEKAIILIGLGGPSNSVMGVLPASPKLTIAAPTLVLSANGLYDLAFNITNTNAFQIQVSANCRYLGSSRGFT